RDLERAFAMLSMPPEDLRERGGAEEMLASAGVRSIVLSALGPSAVEGADHEAEDVVANPARVPDAHLLASQLRIDELAGRSGTHLAAAGVRHLDLVDLTEALEAGREEAGTILAGLEAVGVDLTQPRTDSPEGSVTDALAGYLAATERDDVRTIQATLPRTDEQRKASALLARRDYLMLEGDDERLGEVLSLWAEGLQEAMAMRDPVRVRELLDSVREALGGAGEERESLYGSYARQALAPEAVLALVATVRLDDVGA